MTSCVHILLGLVLISVGMNCKMLKFCYFDSESFRVRKLPMDVTEIDPDLCTHLVWAFGIVDVEAMTITTPEYWADESHYELKGRLEQFTDFKKTKSSLKTLMSIEGSSELAAISKNASIRKMFSKQAVKYLRQHKLDGLEVHWMDPPPSPEQNTTELFMELLRELRKNIKGCLCGMILTASLSHDPETIEKSYDLEAIHSLVDYCMLVAYNFSSVGSKVAGFNSPLYSRNGSDSTLSISWTINRYLKEGFVPPSKIVVVISFKFNRYVLADRNINKPGSPVTMESRKGKVYRMNNFLAYPEICMMRREPAAATYWSEEQEVPFMVNGDNFVGYENTKSFFKKIKFISDNHLAGIAVWSLSLDDRTGRYCYQGKYPLLTSISEVTEALDPEKERFSSDATAARATWVLLTLCCIFLFTLS